MLAHGGIKRLEEKAEQGIFKDFEIGAYGFLRHATVAGGSGKVDFLAVALGRYLQELAKGFQIADKLFPPYLLFQVSSGVGGEIVIAVLFIP